MAVVINVNDMNASISNIYIPVYTEVILFIFFLFFLEIHYNKFELSLRGIILEKIVRSKLRIMIK